MSDRVQIPYSFSYPVSGFISTSSSTFSGGTSEAVTMMVAAVGAPVTITNRDTGNPATIWQAETGASFYSSISTDSGGNVPGWLDAGSYKIVAGSVGGFAGATINFDPSRGDGTTLIAPGAVTSAAIAAGAVTQPAIATGSVTSTAIANNTIVASDVSLTSGIWALGGGFVSVPSNATLTSGVISQVADGVTATLPAPTQGAMVGVIANIANTSQQIIVQYGTGLGLILGDNNTVNTSSSSFTCATPGSCTVLLADGTNWQVISGARSISFVVWANLTFTGGRSNSTPPPAVSLTGSGHVAMRGSIGDATFSAPIPANTALAIVPAGYRPTTTKTIAAMGNGGGGSPPASIAVNFTINSSGVLTSPSIILGGGGFGGHLDLAGVTYITP